MTLTLPMPPSNNRYWRHPRRGPLAGRSLLSREARDYRTSVIQLLAPMLSPWAPTTRLACDIVVHAPTRARRDLDNIPKALLDALQAAGVLHDDGQIDDLRVRRGATRRPGQVVVTITPMGDA